jgi:hypothetical protein
MAPGVVMALTAIAIRSVLSAAAFVLFVWLLLSPTPRPGAP